MSSFLRQKITDGVYFNTISDNRFKTARITVSAYVPMTKDTASHYALLTQVLTRSCSKYPTLRSLSKRCSYLYGASIYSDVSKVGDAQCLSFTMSFIDDRYTMNGERISTDISELLCNILFNPLVKDGKFSDFELEQERRQLCEWIDSEYNDKQIYAREQLNLLMCKDEPYGLPKYGDKQDIAQITTSSLYDAWQDLLQNARFEILFIGSANSKSAFDIFNNAFSKYQNNSKPINHLVLDFKSEQRYEQTVALSQSKLVMGFRTNIAEGKTDTTAMRLAIAILGGTANSKLFNNVREKLSLCYYCSAQYNRLKGIVTVQSGIKSENIDKTYQAILNEIKEMQAGNITDFEFNSTKLAICDSFKGLTDTTKGLETWYGTQLFFDKVNTIEQEVQNFQNITKQQVIEAINTLKLDTTFVLRGTGEEE